MQQRNHTETRDNRGALKPLLVAILSVLTATAQAADNYGLFDLGSVNGAEGGEGGAIAVSASGNVVVGDATMFGASGYSGNAYRWTPEQGMVDLGKLNGGNYAFARDVNAKGDVIVGEADDGNFPSNSPLGLGAGIGYEQRAFRWTQAEGMVSLGTLNGGTYSSASGVNEAGDVVVGATQDGPDQVIDVNGSAMHLPSSNAFRWTPTTGMVSLGTLQGDTVSEANDVNAKGDVVVGNSMSSPHGYFLLYQSSHAFRWTEEGGMVGLGSLISGGNSEARAVNAAGDVVVGSAQDGPDQVIEGDGFIIHRQSTSAFRWTQSGGMVSLGKLHGGFDSYARAVNATGDVVVGEAEDGAISIPPTNSQNVLLPGDHPYRAFRWTRATGMQSVEEWLKASGVVVNPDGPHTQAGYGVNADGSVVVGSLDNGHAFIARASGLIDSVEYQQSLAASAHVAAPLLQDTDQIMHGAHGSPMRGLLEGGKQSVWVAGDWGRADHKQNDGNLGGGEFGYGLGITSSIMAKLALGGTYAQQNTVFGGNTRMDGIYVMPEMIANFSGTPLYATLSAYYNSGNADIERGYLNAGNTSVSKGSADTRVAAFRARLDWLNALKFSDTALTPYTSFTYANTRIDGYSETGGGFPVYWARRSEETTELRYGLDAVHRLTDSFNLLGRVEGVHRFEDHGTHARGQILGLQAFDFNGQSYQQDWLRTSLGVEGSFGGYGTATVTFNGTSEGPSPSYWLAASYRWNF